MSQTLTQTHAYCNELKAMPESAKPLDVKMIAEIAIPVRELASRHNLTLDKNGGFTAELNGAVFCMGRASEQQSMLMVKGAVDDFKVAQILGKFGVTERDVTLVLGPVDEALLRDRLAWRAMPRRVAGGPQAHA